MSESPALEAAPADERNGAGRAAWALVAIAFLLAAAGHWLSVSTDRDSFADTLLYDVSWWAIALSWAVVGALIASRQPRNPIGWILVGLTLFAGAVALADGYCERFLAGEAGSEAAGELATWFSKSGSAWIPLVLLPLALLPLYFPHGGHPGGRWRVVPRAAGVGIALFWFSEAFAAGPLYDYPELENPYGIDSPLVEAAGFGSLLVLGTILASAASVVVRFRRASGVERQQIKWLAYAACLAATTLVVGAPIGGLWSEDLANALILAGVVGLTVGIGIAVLRHGLYDIDLLINRTLVYGGLTAGVVAVYVVLVGGASILLHERAGLWLALVATGLAAVLAQPVRSGLQRRVNRLMYGSAEAAGATGLRGRLQETFVPEAAEVQRAREQLVSAREEERRRLRRDLHDGLGPALAGAALKVEAAQNLLGSRPADAADLLERARAEIQDAVAEVRRLVYDLRPPALDELGLVGALREQADRLSTGGAGGLRIDVDAPARLNGLPAAVEVAAYRIALEAMTNTARHADARTCHVHVDLNGAVELDVVDDGTGLPDGHRPGVGMASMHERAEELGGTCVIANAAPRGTRVHARLPLEVAT